MNLFIFIGVIFVYLTVIAWGYVKERSERSDKEYHKKINDFKSKHYNVEKLIVSFIDNDKETYQFTFIGKVGRNIFDGYSPGINTADEIFNKFIKHATLLKITDTTFIPMTSIKKINKIKMDYYVDYDNNPINQIPIENKTYRN